MSDEDTDNTDRRDKTISLAGARGWEWASGSVLLWVQAQESGCHLVLDSDLAPDLASVLAPESALVSASELVPESALDWASGSEFDSAPASAESVLSEWAPQMDSILPFPLRPVCVVVNDDPWQHYAPA